MFYLENGDIIPNSRISSIALGMTMEDIKTILQGNSIDKLGGYATDIDVYKGGNVKIWLTDNKVTQISVFANFEGKLLGEFGIGSYLTDIEKKLKVTAKEELDVNIFDEMKGICFELSEDDNGYFDDHYENDLYTLWAKANLPIEIISVYSADD